MKKMIITAVIATLFFLVAGCTIKVIPLNYGRVPLPPTSLEFNTYGSGWGWPFVYWPGVSWGQYYHYYPYQSYGYYPYQHQHYRHYK